MSEILFKYHENFKDLSLDLFHDYDGVEDNKALYDQLGMPDSYYSFSHGDWVFIMLNTNEISSYALKDDLQGKEELTEMLDKVKAKNGKNGATYNGGISKQQLDWLRDELNKAKADFKNVLVFSHHPLYAATGLTVLNDNEIEELLSAYACVKAVVSGLHHPGAFGKQEHITYITTEGMIETESENAYGVVEIYTDRIEFTGKGRSKSYSIQL